MKNNWIDVALIISEDINAIVECPHCHKGSLIVKDVAFDYKHIEKGGERYLICPNCQRFEVILYKFPPSNWYQKAKI